MHAAVEGVQLKALCGGGCLVAVGWCNAAGWAGLGAGRGGGGCVGWGNMHLQLRAAVVRRRMGCGWSLRAGAMRLQVAVAGNGGAAADGMGGWLGGVERRRGWPSQVSLACRSLAVTTGIR